MLREQLFQQFLLIRLVFITAAQRGRRRPVGLQRFDGEQPLDDDSLLDRRFELVVDHVQLVERAFDEVVGQILADIQRMLETEFIEDLRPLLTKWPVATTEKVSALAADETDGHFMTESLVIPEGFDSFSNDVRVERATEAAIARNDQDLDLVAGSLLQQRVRRAVHATAQIGENLSHLMRVG